MNKRFGANNEGLILVPIVRLLAWDVSNISNQCTGENLNLYGYRLVMRKGKSRFLCVVSIIVG